MPHARSHDRILKVARTLAGLSGSPDAPLDLRAFITGDGTDILAIELSSGVTFRYAMP